MDKFIIDLYRLESLATTFDILTIDCSKLVAKTTFTFSGGQSSELLKKRFNVVVPTTLSALDKFLSLTPESAQKIVLCNELRNERLIEILISRKIRSFQHKGAIVISLHGGFMFDKDRRRTIFERVKDIRTVRELFISTRRTVIRKFSTAVYPYRYDYSLVAGSDYREQLQGSKEVRCGNKYGHFIPVISLDYERYIHASERPKESRLLVYLDPGAPLFAADGDYLGMKCSFTAKEWYPALCRFFDFVERRFSVQTIIASHYKSNHTENPDYFGGRPAVYGETACLIKSSQIVVALTSTAVSMAVIGRKPLIFIFNDEITVDHRTFRTIESLSFSLSAPLLNIDRPEDWGNSVADIKPNIDSYTDYKDRFLSSGTFPERTYLQLINDLVSR